MNPMLKAESDWWKATASRYGFGLTEVAPIYSNAEAIRNYMTKQDWRDKHWPFVEKKSVRFWSCSTGLSAGKVNFAWNSPGGQICRARMKEWAHDQGCETYDELPAKLGKNWGYQFHQHISWLRALDRLGGEVLPAVKGPLGTMPAAGWSALASTNRADGVETHETQAGGAPVPLSGVGSVVAVGACVDSSGRPAPSAMDGWVPRHASVQCVQTPICAFSTP